MTVAPRLALAVHARPTTTVTLGGMVVATDALASPLPDPRPGVDMGEAVRLAMLDAPDGAPSLRVVEDDPLPPALARCLPTDPVERALCRLRPLAGALQMLRDARADDNAEWAAACAGDVREVLAEIAGDVGAA